MNTVFTGYNHQYINTSTRKSHPEVWTLSPKFENIFEFKRK